MVAGDFTPSFALDLAAKDVGLVLEAAERHDLALALAPVVLEQLQAASAAGHGADDLAAVFTASSR
jgi:3-hydroxyisobutyrate dehydrogenase